MTNSSDKKKQQAEENLTEQDGAEQGAADADQAAMADDWAAALAEQEAVETDTAFADAGEPAAADTAAAAPASAAASADVFKPLDQDRPAANGARDLDMVMDIPVKLDVVLGRTKITIKQLLELTEGSVVELDGLAGDPLDILINGYLVAQGEVVVVDDKYGIRIIEIVNPSERIQKLNQ